MGPRSQSPNYHKSPYGDVKLKDIRYQISLIVNIHGPLIMEANEEGVVANVADVGVIEKAQNVKQILHFT